MLTAIPFQHKQVNPSFENLKLEKTSADCSASLPSLVPYDVLDNPGQKQFLVPGATEENIFQQMKSEYNRLLSFQNKWPLRDITPESLAEAGLFYLQYEDKVQCPFCYIIIFNWTQEDKPLREHMRKSPKCPFLMGCDGENVPLSGKHEQNVPSQSSEKKYSSISTSVSYKPKHPRMADVKRRLMTYSGWPLNEPEPQQLAECGLYYSGVADVVVCFFCGGSLGNWEPDDEPWNEHTKFFPECSFLALARNKKTPPKIVNSCNKELTKQKHSAHKPSSAENISEIIEQAIDIFPEDLVHEAVRNKNGSLFSLQEICDDILELKQKPKLQTQTTPVILQETNSKTKSNSASNTDLLLCKVCMDRERGVVFQPCGHFVSCWNCANLIADCPVCRRPIIHKIKTYIS